MLPYAGSDISSAIKFGIHVLSEQKEHENSQIILITDGDSEKPDVIINELKRQNPIFKVSVLGIGKKTNTPVPALDGDSQWMIDNNVPVFSNRNDKLLKFIADFFNGSYRTITGPETKINTLIGRSTVKIELDGTKSNVQWKQLYHPFLLLAALFIFVKTIMQRE